MSRNVVDFARRIRRSEGFKSLVATPGRLAIRAQQRLNHGVFSIEIREISGFFSVLQMVLFVLMYCDEKHLFPDISARGKIYGDPSGRTDWFGALFEPVGRGAAPSPARKVRTSKVADLVHLGFRKRYERRLTIDDANRLFLSYYRPSASVTEEVDALCRSLDIGATTLGVHFRGTDKKLEAVPVSWQDFCALVASVLRENPQLTNVFVSSDEAAFIDYFTAQPFGVPVHVAPARHLASGGLPVHFSGHPGLAIAREALVACLLLSRCGYLVKTPSYLSGWSKIFNPALPVRLASPPRPDAFWFPDSQLWTESASAAAAQAPAAGEDAFANASPNGA
ncbi:O-fucosyltransferase family protein [Paraburkholderia caballeronis]|uniref:Nodulation protein Z (NodZ) n=1 Tax=Paraburkholderia caballeronis TaxID=416943 RepID=A0A1H7P6U8_9BURK|nr:hypothetical protein [Paraburkholderia caballeronis]PXW25369.1 hypothetical protein C7403_10552 [Paraburkholderia caballeronis]PXX00976.1 hypothetical protein C7407_10551 [Paraburkholderia caballeronis]RAJ99671.1 hypothetical protein C7409_105400 [Paraburkholderia caballeronis]SEE40172.1 hypothetical protein SAMN05445871_5377 [Paraburkholderia caballeronis]SEL31128.1 hypothetical protein SAMN05192542_106245 [Paraburkholderia caballeronis]